MNKIKKEVQKAYAQDVVDILNGRGYSFKVEEVLKNNGAEKVQVTEVKAGSEFGISVNVEPIMLNCYEKYGYTDAVYGADYILSLNNYHHNLQYDICTSWEDVKDKIFFTLVNSGKNASLLSHIPSRQYTKELSIVYRVCTGESEMGLTSYQVRNDMLNKWEVDEAELYQRALENTPRLFPAEISDLNDFLLQNFDNISAEFIREAAEEGGEEGRRYAENLVAQERARITEAPNVYPMYILRNKSGLFGTSALLYPGMIQNLTDQYGEGFYLIPSSIHEWIIVPAENAENSLEEFIKDLICDVNQTVLKAEEFLSDSLFVVFEGKVMIVDGIQANAI